VRPLPAGMREKVLAAAELFAASGLDATKMEDLAATTGVPKATLYYYFEGKEDILAFLFNEILAEIQRAIDDALRTEGTAADRLRAAIVAHLRVFEDFPAASRALQFDLGRAARIPHIDERIEAAFRGPVRQLLEAGAQDGSLRTVDHPRLVAIAILGAVTTVGINALTLGPRRPVEEIADVVIDVVLHGVGVPA
jgi:TetR/AcrR family transcriptional regulator